MGNCMKPDFVLESSWEVCNKVGGIYTVLSSRAKTLNEILKGNLLFIGPDIWEGKANPLFEEDATLWPEWKSAAMNEGIILRLGHWNIPGRPCVALVKFDVYYPICNDIFAAAWNDYNVDSLHGYGDYQEASMFSYAAGRVVESFWNNQLNPTQKVIFQAHEWMTGLGALYIRKHVPQIATVFTTHATTIGRSIAGNQKPLYEYLWTYNGNQMAGELNVEAKHSIERQTAHNVDCFSTVSDVTARECMELLDRQCDAVLMNGFEADFVPQGIALQNKRQKARKLTLEIANALTGCTYPDNTLIVSTSGRYEFRNKGIDIFLEAIKRLSYQHPQRPVLAILRIPGWQQGPRTDLQERLSQKKTWDTPLDHPIVTHDLHNFWEDNVVGTLHRFEMANKKEDSVHVMFVPCYLDGNDGIFDTPYYDLLVGDDLAVYPSYYEPWGYTPLEAIAFHVPCITTSLSGFGAWVCREKNATSHLQDGVEVLQRNDYNYSEVADGICQTILEYVALNETQVKQIRKRAADLSKKALWKHFIEYYLDAYRIALENMELRTSDMFRN